VKGTAEPSFVLSLCHDGNKADLLVGLLAGGGRVLVCLLAVLVGRCRVLLRIVVLTHLMMVRGLQMVVCRRRMMRCRLVMALVGRVLGLGR